MKNAQVGLSNRSAHSPIEALENRRLLSVATFNVNALFSVVSGTGTALGLKVMPQAAGSDQARLGGTIVADLEPGTIRFTGGGGVVAASHGSFQPGSAAANFAWTTSTLFGPAYLAIRNSIANFSSSEIPVSSTGAFSSAGATYTVTAGSLAYQAPLYGVGGKSLVGLKSNLLKSPAGKLVISSGGLATITMPFNVTLKIPTSSLGDAIVTIAGQLVATATLPTKVSSVSGNVFNDANSDGKKGLKEVGLAGVRVYLDTLINGKWDANEAAVVTDKLGNFKIIGIVAGSYKLRIVVPAGHKQTTPTTGGGAISLIFSSVPVNKIGYVFGVK